MKVLYYATVLILICLTNLYSQTYQGAYDYMFLTKQVDAQSEAMGQGHVAMYGSSYSAFYNPASSAFSNGLNTEISHLEPNEAYYNNKAYFDSYSASYNFGQYGAASFNEVLYNQNKADYTYQTKAPYNKLTYTPKSKFFVFNYSYMITDDFSAGLNVDYFWCDKGYTEYSAAQLDLGLMKKFHLKSSTANHNFYLGLSCSNITNTKLSSSENLPSYYTSDYQQILPSIMRVGGSYEFEPDIKIADFSLLKTIFALDYKDVLNYKYGTAIQLGTEFTFVEILKIRAGFYSQSLNTDISSGAKEKINEFTYGFGINIPISKFYDFSMPVSLQFDFARIAQPRYYDSYLTFYSDQSVYNVFGVKYSVYSLKLNIGL